jgi:hypothetical protein
LGDWFEEYVKEKIWKAISDFFGDVASWTETKIESYLAGLKKGDKLSDSPLVKVLEVDEGHNTLTLLVRGRVDLFKGVESAFMRIEVVVSRDIDMTGGAFPVDIVEWRTVVGDIKLSKKNVFESNIALGYDKGTWLGRGTLKVIPANFGLDVFVGGINPRGAMIGLDVDLPAPIPLGSTGVGLAGLGGDFAYNFVPRLEADGAPVANPTAKDYVTWARNTEVDRWAPGPIDETAVGLGIRSDFVTVFDSGYTLKLEPIGLAVLTPGPIFVLGGSGKLIKSDSAKVTGFLAVDIASASIALGLSADLKFPDIGGANIVEAGGKLDAFFSFEDPSLWYLNLGTNKKPIHAKVLKGLFHGEAFFMIDNKRVCFGAGISIGGSYKWWVITLVARLGARAYALIGWNPKELEGAFAIYGELGLKIWFLKFLLTGQTEILGHTANPNLFSFTLRYKLSLPWPIPDIEGDKTFSYSDEQPEGGKLESPLLVGESDVW